MSVRTFLERLRKKEEEQEERGNMIMIAGLGNPTAQYRGTRHNMGFEVIDRLAKDAGISVETKKFKALCGTGVIGGQKVILVKPQTYMNLSGESLRQVMDYYQVDPSQMIVICDDINLAPGQLRIRKGGSAGGHNGLKNIIQHCGTQDFPRVRVGVGEKPAHMDLADYVLSHISGPDAQAVDEGLDDAAKAVRAILEDGIDSAMNIFNRKKKD